MNKNLTELYDEIIEDVIENIKNDFENAGIGEDVLIELKKV
jgi:hypothetical protein